MVRNLPGGFQRKPDLAQRRQGQGKIMSLSKQHLLDNDARTILYVIEWHEITHLGHLVAANIINVLTTTNVKGCKMPAPSRRRVSVRKPLAGRRLTGLEGGNRGRKPHGQGRL